MSAIHTNVPSTARDHRTEERRVDTKRPVVVDHRANERERGHGPVVIDHGNDRDRDRDRPIVVTPAPVVVTTYDPGYRIDPGYTYRPAPIAVMGSTELDQGQIAIDTANELVGATNLQLYSTGSGSTYVSQVVLYDADGSYQVVKLDTILSSDNPSATVALGNGGAVVKVVVDGQSNWGGAIAINAR